MKTDMEKPATHKDRIADFKARCSQARLRITPQRMAVYNELIKSKEHPSADTLYREVRKTFPNISLDTVNRTLLTLSEMGFAFIVEGSGDVKRYDGQLDNHQHFRCIKCKRIIDFYHRPFDNIEVPADIRSRFTVLRKTVYFEGVCDSCQGKR